MRGIIRNKKGGVKLKCWVENREVGSKIKKIKKLGRKSKNQKVEPKIKKLGAQPCDTPIYKLPVSVPQTKFKISFQKFI